MNHDEFMRRVVESASLDQAARDRVDNLGREYLAEVSRMDPLTRAMALSSYEDGGLEAVFRAMLTAPDWNEPSLGAFKHFLVEHIKLDSGEDRTDPCAGTSLQTIESFRCGGVQKSAYRRRPPSLRLKLRAKLRRAAAGAPQSVSAAREFAARRKDRPRRGS